MKTTRLIAALTTLVAMAAAAPAGADDKPTCTFTVKQQLKIGYVNKHGLPVEATCDGPFKVIAAFQFVTPSKPDYDWLMLHSGGVPGISGGAPTDLPSAGTYTLRATMIPKKFVRRYKRVPLNVNVAIQDPEHPTWFRDVGRAKRVVLVR